MRDVGELGENVLGQWAAEVGIIANKVRRDRMGWDFFLEIPAEAIGFTANLPLDRKQKSIQCLVQIKSSDKRQRRWPVKLSNWARLVTSSLPAFFLVLEFDGETICQRSYLVHIKEEHIRTVLRRLREFTVSSPQQPLHKSTITFTFGPSERLRTNDGHGLLQGLLQHVRDPDAYSSQKEELLQTIGYEEGGQVVHATIQFPLQDRNDPHKALVEWALGVSDDLHITEGAEVYDERFGIRLPKPVHIIPTAGLMRAVPNGRGLLRLQSLDGQRERAIEIDVFSSSSVEGYVPEESHQVRMRSRFLDVFVPLSRPRDWECRIRVPKGEERLSLDEFRVFADVILLFEESTADDGLNMQAEIEGHRFSGRLQSRFTLEDDLIEVSRAVRSAIHITSRLGGPVSILTSLSELFSQRKVLEVMEGALLGNTLGARLSYSVPFEQTVIEHEVCFPVQLDVHLDDRVIAIAAAYFGVPHATGAVEDGTLEVVFDASRVEVLVREFTNPGEVPRLTREDMLEEVACRFEEMEVIRWWDHQTE